jgi:hypothetical protein
MKNLHLKNIEESQIDIISTNRNYLNSIFKRKNLTFDEFSKKLVLHQNHKPDEKQKLLKDLYEIYKLNIKNYKYIALLIKKYNQGKDSSNNLPKEYVNLMINHYIVEQLIKELFTKEQQKLFYQYIENLALLYNENYPKNLFKIDNEPIQNNYSIAVILLLCIRTLKKENLLKIKPEKLNIRLTINKEENIKLQIMNNLPKKETITRSIKYNETVEKFIEKLTYLNIVTQA